MPFGREGDVVDLFANSIGVGVGLLLAMFYSGGWAQRAESRLRQFRSAS